ncbi:MAG: peptidase S9 [Gammaproteobacteria bacterium]|nr:MAG: peptidase S9 [Gammaproteobacteria bacterium]
MNKTQHTILLLITLFCSLSFNAISAPKQQLSYKQFGHLAMFQHPTVSPDGNYIAALYNSPAGPQVVVSDFGSTQLSTIAKLKKSQNRIDGITWVNNERIIIFASYSKRFLGDRIRVNRLFSVNKDGSDFKLLKRRNTKGQSSWMDVMSSSRIVSLLEGDKEHVLLKLYDERDKAWSVFKVNVYTNEFKKLFVNTYKVSSWYANTKGDVVFGVGRKKDTTTIWYRQNNNEDWKKLHTQKAYTGATFSPVMVKGNKAIVISDNELYRKALWQYDIKTGKFDKLLYANDKYDISSAILNPEGTEVIGVRYSEHFQKNYYFNPADAKLNRIVKKSFKQYNTFIVDFSSDRKKVLVLAQRDDSPSKYFWLDLQKRSGGFWFSTYPDLEGKQLAKVKPFEFTTKKGMTLNGYLTLPANLKAGEKPPLIVHPHGGPQSRDYQYFDPFVQYFASQGYAVLQVNFRGSTGFGNNYMAKGYRQWGEASQQDVYEAVDWLAQQNTVDTNKSCIVGASYGGYMALTAAFQKPELFDCVVSIAGIGDVLALVEDEYKYPTMRAFIKKTIGDPKDNDDISKLKKVSAINYVERITAPMLLIHGTYDTQVNYNQSVDFTKKAKRAGVKVNYVELKHATHYLDENDNRLAAFKVMGEFLQKYLR